MVDVPFFTVCNSLANERHMDVVFYEDQYDGWFARFSFSELRGPYSAEVGLIGFVKPRSSYKFSDAWSEYEAKVRRACDQAISKAHSRRSARAAV